MIFTLFTLIVFISEIIVTFAIIIALLKLDKKINKTHEFLNNIKPKIKVICELCTKISSQVLELIPVWIDNASKHIENAAISGLKNIAVSGLFWGLNIKIIKKIRRMKFLKAAIKGFSFIQNVI